MDPDTLTPQSRTVDIHLGSADASWTVYDQLASGKKSIGRLSEKNPSLAIDIPAAGVRLLALKRTGH